MWIINALSIVCPEMLKLSRNNQNIKMFGVLPNTLPLVIYIGIFCYWVLLHYNMSFKTIAGGFNGAFWWYGPLSVALRWAFQSSFEMETFKPTFKNIVPKVAQWYFFHYFCFTYSAVCRNKSLVCIFWYFAVKSSLYWMRRSLYNWTRISTFPSAL